MSSERDQSATEDAPPVAVLLGMNSVPAPEGVGIATMTIQDKHRQRAGVVQGGLIVTLADYAFFEAVHTRTRPGDTAVTVELKVNFLAPARDGELTATARLIGAGRRIVVGGGRRNRRPGHANRTLPRDLPGQDAWPAVITTIAALANWLSRQGDAIIMLGPLRRYAQ